MKRPHSRPHWAYQRCFCQDASPERLGTLFRGFGDSRSVPRTSKNRGSSVAQTAETAKAARGE
jgi:hypothetical protein